ncbi:MAG: AI-2E family transporter [archaeon]|nr:AI-2E family transporter [archaeon]MCR4323805.1 AI-2E family transporter [Nanoarchaeota archaeon]
MTQNLIIKQGAVAVGIVGIFVLAFFVIKEIIVSLTIGLLAAYVFSPIYKKILKITKRKNTVAFLLILAIIVIIVVPILYLTPMIINQTFSTYVMFQNLNLGELLGKFMNAETAGKLSIHLDNLIGVVFSTALDQFKDFLVNLPSVLLQFAVFLFTFFFALRDSETLKRYISELSPFSKSTEEKFMKELRGITNSIVYGQVFIGVVQGLALGVGLFLLGVPKALVLTVVACLISIIPILGSWLIWVPVSITLLITGQTFSGVFLLLYGALFVSTIDNFLRSYILSRQSNLPVSLSIIGTIGGLYFFGIMGLVFGPLIFAYVLIIIEFYKMGKLDELFKK